MTTCKQCQAELPLRTLLSEWSMARWCSKECMSRRIAELEAGLKPFASMAAVLSNYNEETYLISLFRGFEYYPKTGCKVSDFEMAAELLKGPTP